MYDVRVRAGFACAAKKSTGGGGAMLCGASAAAANGDAPSLCAASAANIGEMARANRRVCTSPSGVLAARRARIDAAIQ